MRRLFIIGGVLMTFAFSLYGQHVPPGHGHNGPICWGYATGRAYGKTWSSTSECNASIISRDIIDSKQSQTYFQWDPNYSQSKIQVGDIIEFGNGSHASYVSSTWGGIYVDQVENEGGQEQTGIPIAWVISGHSNPAIIARGNPTGFWRKKGGWSTEVKNEFSGGTVKVGSTVHNSPYQFNAGWNISRSIEATMDGELFQGYVRLFDNWSGETGIEIANRFSVSTSFKRTDSEISQSKSVTAHFVKQFDVTFKNNFIGVGNAGVIKVDGEQHSLPADPFHVRQDNSITGQAMLQNYNGITYSFDQWHDGSTSASRVFTPTNHATYTAYYTGKPVAVTITSYSGPPGTWVKIVWQEHSNPNVSKYQVWRKVKQSGGGWLGPTLLATKNRGTTSFTDYEYVFTEGYSEDLLEYDIRAYYSVENSYADPNWVVAFGELLPKAVAEHASNEATPPTEYALTNYPNPFNPTTQIHFQLAADARVGMAIYNMRGRLVVNLVNESLKTGYYSMTWDGRDRNDLSVGSGVYLARMVVKPAQKGPIRVLTHRLVMLK